MREGRMKFFWLVTNSAAQREGTSDETQKTSS